MRVPIVNNFLKKLMVFKEIFPVYGNKKNCGAVAYIKASPEATRFAYRKGLFVIRAVGESATILNDAKFKPKDYGRNS
ncbi:MAG: hypothetical protein N3F09_08695 [Bacteroidia bacterium]|nr:hypothetical protein [Bacteroidia bacterium]